MVEISDPYQKSHCWQVCSSKSLPRLVFYLSWNVIFFYLCLWLVMFYFLGSFPLDKISSFLKWVPAFLWDLWWVGREITFWFMVCVFLSIFENPSSGCWFASFCFCPFGWCMAVILCFWLLHISNSILLRGDSCANPSLIFFVFELYYFWVKVWMMPVMY